MIKHPTPKLDEDFFIQFNKVLNLKKNQLVFGPTTEPSGIFYVKSGFVRQYLISSDGKEITFNILKPGSYFSMIWALNDVPNIYYYESLTNVQLLKAPKEEVVKYVESHPEILYDIAKRSLSGLDGMTRLMEALLTGNAYQQVASVLLVLARRFGRKKDGGIVIGIPLTHRIIGTLAGLARESTSIELKKLSEDKIITQKDHLILIKNFDKLKESSPITFVEESVF